MTLLVLAGTREARDLCAALVEAGVDGGASLAGATRDPAPLALPTRHGGFGGEAGFRAHLSDKGITSVVDATHPFAARITARTVAVCHDLNIPCLRLERPGWTAGTLDKWQWVEGPSEVVAGMDEDATVFLATGRQSLPGFLGMSCRAVFLRQIDPPDRPFPFSDGGYVLGRPPFSVSQEVETLERLGVTDLVVKDAGGDGGRAKLTAAGRLGVKVWIVRRPQRPDVRHVQTVAEAVNWVRAQCG